jgi:hypothetical protein
MSITYNLSRKDLPQALRRVLEKVPRANLIRANRRTAARTLPIVSIASPVDLGIYRNRWDVDNLPNGATLYNDAPYAAVIELGSRPHWPPLAPILAWASRKAGGITTGTGRPLASRKGGRPASTSTHTAGENAEIYAFAMAVQRHIARYGTKPKFVLRNAIPRSKTILREESIRAMREVR